MTNSFAKPETFIKLENLNQELIKETGMSLDDYIGIELDFNGYNYEEMTPNDSIVFASTGVDGDHFAFHTQDGTIVELEEAPIVFVQPMDSDAPVKLVAKNIKDLISLYLSLRDFYVLVGFDWYESKEDFINDYNKNYKEELEEREEEFKTISHKLINLLNIVAIEDPYSYINAIRERVAE